MYSASDVALWFLSNNQNITNLKLQKLLYYAQGTFLAMTDSPLFQDDILKWRHGPVVPSVYEQYRSFGDRKISNTTQPPQIADIDIFLLNKVCELFGGHSAWQLSEMTHNERPWMVTETNETIENSIIKDYFKKNIFAPVLSDEIFDSIPIVEGKRDQDGVLVFPSEYDDEE